MTLLAVVAAAMATWLTLRPPAFCWRVHNLRHRDGSTRPTLPQHDSGARGSGSRPESPDSPGPGDVASCAEMLAVAVAAGCPIAEALSTVGQTKGSGAALASQASALRRGQPLEDVLDSLAGHPDGSWHSLATLLSLSATSGAPTAGPLRRLAAQERTRLRRRREQRARRLPVMLLLPLSGLVLPAFVLVTVVPFGLAGGASIELPPVNDRPVTTTEEP